MRYQRLKINGYNILFLPVKDAKIIYFQSYILSGRMLETRQNLGIAHLLEHVLAESWKKCKDDCAKYWGERGIITNASVDDTLVNYYVQGLTKDAEDIAKYIIHITTTPHFKALRIKKEKKAVYEELARELNSEDWKMWNKMSQFFYDLEGLKYGDDIKLQIKNLEKFTMRDLIAYYNKVYTPPNILFVIAGKYSKSHIINLFKKHLPQKTGTLNIKKHIFKNNISSRILYIRDKSHKNAEVVFSFVSKIYPGEKESCYFPIITSLLTGSMHSLFMRRLRTELGLIYNIPVSIVTDSAGTLATISTSIKIHKVKQLIKEVKNILKKVCRGEFSTEQLKRVQGVNLISEDKKCKKAVFYGNYYGHQLASQLDKKTPSIIDYERKTQIIAKVTKKDIVALCKKIFPLKKCLILYQSPRKIIFHKTRKVRN